MDKKQEKSEFNQFSDLAKRLFSVPKSEIQSKQSKQKPTKA